MWCSAGHPCILISLWWTVRITRQHWPLFTSFSEGTEFEFWTVVSPISMQVLVSYKTQQFFFFSPSFSIDRLIDSSTRNQNPTSGSLIAIEKWWRVSCSTRKSASRDWKRTRRSWRISISPTFFTIYEMPLPNPLLFAIHLFFMFLRAFGFAKPASADFSLVCLVFVDRSSRESREQFVEVRLM